MTDESELWEDLYNQKMEALRETYKSADTEKKGGILKGLETLIESKKLFHKRLKSSRKQGKRTRKFKRDYLHEIDDPEIAEKIERVLADPDIEQIDSLTPYGASSSIALEMDINRNSFGNIRKRVKERVGSGYIGAKFVHWLLDNGYKIKD